VPRNSPVEISRGLVTGARANDGILADGATMAKHASVEVCIPCESVLNDFRAYRSFGHNELFNCCRWGCMRIVRQSNRCWMLTQAKDGRSGVAAS
jgi:hypothetical protein